MNFPKFTWKEIYDEWYGEPDKKYEKVESDVHGNSTPVLLEDNEKIIEYPSMREASYHLGCSFNPIHKHAKQGTTFMGFKIRKK